MNALIVHKLFQAYFFSCCETIIDVHVVGNWQIFGSVGVLCLCEYQSDISRIILAQPPVRGGYIVILRSPLQVWVVFHIKCMYRNIIRSTSLDSLRVQPDW